ncbi:TKL1 [Symbiodinium sp. KB8]|nr:TKL1 [Symbiodinium sp. KB8]
MSTPDVSSSAKRTRLAMDPLDQTCINNIRVLAADMVQNANSGHPGGELRRSSSYAASIRLLQANRDRFVLSNGHACALQYIMLHLAGYDVSMEDLKSFRKIGSKTPGHPENFRTPGVEVSTGPLGQGISNAVGLAMAEAHMAAVFNKPGFNVIDNYTYALCGDGCLQEGVSSEACSLAGHLGLGKLIVLYDDNQITIDGETELSFSEDVLKRYESYGWHVQHVKNGNEDLEGLTKAIEEAKTVIGFGSQKQGKEATHGAPLGASDVEHVKTLFSFVLAEYRKAKDRGQKHEEEWKALKEAYAKAHPELAAELTRRLNGELPKDWETLLPAFAESDKADATRNLSGIVLNALAPKLPELVGGSADLTPSNKTQLKCTHDFQKGSYDGRYFRFGVREHGMAAICNGIASYGGLVPFCATFLNFIGYAMGAVRLSALSRRQVIYVATHDSIGLGEDGPTHQPVEMLLACRATPNLYVFRPGDGNETSGK